MTQTPVVATIRDATDRTPTARQFVKFAFFAIDPAWRRLDEKTRAAHKAEFAELLNEIGERDGVILKTYSLVGTRGDADLMVWLVGDDPSLFHEFDARKNRLGIGGYLTSPYHYFSMTKRSMYVEKHVHENQEGRSNRLVIAPTNRKYLFVYPFVKTRAWYRLPAEERQRQMTSHIEMGHKYPSVKINTTYSFGLDDQEFVVAFESDSVADFLDLVHEMRETEASTHTVRDVPSFTCMLMDAATALEALG